MLPWYTWLEDRLEPAWPLMLVIAGVIVGITFYLIWTQQSAVLAAWLTYLLMP